MTAQHQHFDVNTKGRDFVVGDLHGMLPKLKKKLAKLDFDPKKDRLFSVGDLIDRGPDSVGCLKLIKKKWFHAVRGNHEELMLDAVSGRGVPLWEINGGGWAKKVSEAEMLKLAKLVESLPVTMTVELLGGRRIGITHAQYPFRNWKRALKERLSRKNEKAVIWGRSVINRRKAQKVKNVDLTIHGHTPIKKSLRLGSALFIDTGCVYGGKLTIIDLNEYAASELES